MTQKLTLSITNQKALERGKRYARRQGKSLSRIVEQYLETLPDTEPTKSPDTELSQLSGLIKLPRGTTTDKLRREALRNKYGL